MSSIYQRNHKGNFVYQIIINGKKERITLNTDKLSIAKREKTRLDAKFLDMKENGIQGNILIEEAFKKYLNYKQNTVKTSTYKRYKQQLFNLKNFFDKEKIRYINKVIHDDLIKYIEYRTNENSCTSTIQTELRLLRSTMEMLYNNHQLKEIPIRNFPKIKATIKNAETKGKYNKKDVKKMIDYFKEFLPEFHDYFIFFIYTGARHNELLAIKKQDIDIENETLKLKNNKTESNGSDAYRKVPIFKQLKPILIERMNDKKPNDLLFPEAENHGYNWMRRCIEKA